MKNSLLQPSFCKMLWLSTFLYWSYSIWEHLCNIQCVTLSMSFFSRGEFFLKFCKDKSRLALAHARGHFQGQELKKIHTKIAFFCNWDTDFLVSFRAEVNWFPVPEFASVALSDVRRTEVNPKLPIAKSVRELLNQDIFLLWGWCCTGFDEPIQKMTR